MDTLQRGVIHYLGTETANLIGERVGGNQRSAAFNGPMEKAAGTGGVTSADHAADRPLSCNNTAGDLMRHGVAHMLTILGHKARVRGQRTQLAQRGRNTALLKAEKGYIRETIYALLARIP
jgi:hypothetical protein